MKTSLLIFGAAVLATQASAQTYTPIAVTGYNLDAIAETSPALNSTTGIIDGSNYVLYSQAYGAAVGTSYGVPNSGTITNGLRSYQMNSFAANNTLFVPAGLKDSLLLSTPASYSAISLLGFATEGAGTMNVTMKFTDGTTQVFNSVAMPDWFNNSGAVITGIDRTGRTTNSPDYLSTNPRMYGINLTLTCANRLKSVAKIVIQNTTSNPRICVFAVSGAALPTYTVNTTGPACFGGSTGTATIVTAGGLPAFTYTWTTSPVQNAATANNLQAGTYTATIKDAAACINTITATITQPTVAPTTTIAASSTTLCSGSTTTLTTSGAVTYTWSNSASTATAVITPTTSGTYSVIGTDVTGCGITGSISITVNPLPVISFSLAQNILCANSSSITLNASPSGGTYSGAGVTGTGFSPAIAGVGTNTISYSYTNGNNCTANSIVSYTVNAAPVISFALPQNIFCVNWPTVNLSATPVGGTFSGAGVTGSVFSPAAAGVGTHTISYSYTNTDNCSATSIVSNTVSACTGIEELNSSTFALYPNPANGAFFINATQDLHITIINEMGQTIKSLDVKAGNNTIAIENLSAGIYMITAQNAQQIIQKKIMVTN